MKKIFSKGTDKEKKRLIAKMYGKNVLEFKRKDKQWKVMGDNLQVYASSKTDPEKIRHFAVENGEIKTDTPEDFDIEDVEFKPEEK